jgi:uncharacterized membrane protein YbhN (UPF0104 family)
MQSEEQIEHLEQIDEVEKGERSNTSLWIAAHALAFLIGLGLLTFLVWNVGYQSLLESISRVGWGFIPIVALNLSRHFFRAASMYLAVEKVRRTFKYRSALAARFGGEAVTFFTFTGPFLGDATKAVLLKKNLPLTYGASAIIIDNILYYVSVILVILAGVGALVLTYGAADQATGNVLILIAIFGVVLFSVLIAAIKYRVTPVSSAIGFLAKRGLVPQFLIKKRENILDVERIVFQFYHERRGDFFKIFTMSMGVHVLSVAEVFLALRYLGFDPLVSTAFIIESLTKVINAVFGFIPGTIGVYEGGNGLILNTLGYTTAVGLALALVRRGAILFSTLIGLIVLLWRGAARGAQHLAEKRDK